MRFLTPSRLIAVVALVVAAIGLGVADAGTRHSSTSWHPGQSCPGKHQLERNKRNVVAYYTTAFNDKNPRLAVKRYGGSEYIQHNPLAANGFDAFIGFVEGLTSQYPDVHIDIRRVFADCDHVVTHGLLTGAVPLFTERGNKVVDIFRFDRRGKIVEHWDVLAPISETSANGNPEV
jgi:predicted SnoaL-like aldol condensation-catalyzing enzyme